MPRDRIAVTDVFPLGPSKMPWPWTHSYSVPERSTPRITTRWPLALTSSLPATRTCGPVPAPAVPRADGYGDGSQAYRPIPATAPATSTAILATRACRRRAGRGTGGHGGSGSPTGLGRILVAAADGNFVI